MSHDLRRRSSLLGFFAFQEIPDSFPSHPADLAREVVGASHRDLQRVKELVGPRPALARAATDWGFGDWEDALGAASHVGNRAIAEYLIEQGARPSIFSAAMLGQLDVVKAFVAAQPGIQRIPGPHSISLLAHARAGGKTAQPVFDFLQSLGDAGSPPAVSLTKEQMQSLAGEYAAGTRRLPITERNGQLWFGTRGLFHLGDLEFHPAGARTARIRFAGDTVTIHDGPLVVTAKRIRN